MDILEQANRIALDAKRKFQARMARKERIKRWLHDTGEWIRENPEAASLILTGGVFMVKTSVGLARDHRRANLLKEQKMLKENYCYDRSLGHYWELRRKPNNREWSEINKRKREGEKLGDILAELKLLK